MTRKGAFLFHIKKRLSKGSSKKIVLLFALFFSIFISASFSGEPNITQQQESLMRFDKSLPAEKVLFESPLRVELPPELVLVKEVDLKNLTHPRVQFYIEYFTKDARKVFAQWLERAGKYKELIQKELKAKGLPTELFYLAMIESGLNPYARSRAGAGGIWQFMPGTARRYGLTINYWVDERRDPVKSTKAAISYIEDLYLQFGNLALALASYNAGEAKVQRVVETHQTEDYWELIEYPGLRNETKDYLPKMIAATIIARNPSAYGFKNLNRAPKWEWDEVEVEDATNFELIARLSGTSLDQIKENNPQLLRFSTPPGEKYKVKLPTGTGERFLVAYKKLEPEEKIAFHYHRVAKGETISRIARRYNITVSELCALNNLSSKAKLREGRTLIIPMVNSKGSRANFSELGQSTEFARGGKQKLFSSSSLDESRKVSYVVKKGDTLYSVANRAGVSIEELKKWNRISGNSIKVGEKLTIYVSPHKASEFQAKAKPLDRKASNKKSEIIHKVQKGESLWSIAEKYNVSVNKLREWNKLASGELIHPGDTLKIKLSD